MRFFFFPVFVLVLVQVSVLSAFAPPPTTSRSNNNSNSRRRRLAATTALFGRSVISRSTPSQAECESLGIREWPQQVKKRGPWTETAAVDTELVRYILQGEGSLVIVDDDGKPTRVQPGTLLRITGPATLQWDVSSVDMILLTPGYEQGGLLLGVAGVSLLVIKKMTILLCANSNMITRHAATLEEYQNINTNVTAKTD
eukprot:scaffold34700_cov256-Amphora_coffeaeformis.AAC.4